MRRLPAFVAAAALAALWGSVEQTQSNLANLIALGAEIPFALRLNTTLFDIAGFGPLYLAVVAATLLVAFPIASKLPGPRTPWFAAAGWLGLIAAVRVIDACVPPPVLIAATRTTLGLFAMTFGGALAGVAYAAMRRQRSR